MKMKSLKIIGIMFLAGFFLFWMPILSSAQEYPTRPINILHNMQPGGVSDTGIRLLASSVEKSLGQPIVISNNAGGAGSVALGIVAKAKPDGYQLASGTTGSLIRVPQMMTVPYKLGDFVPILQYGYGSSGLVVRGDAPWKTLKEFVEYAKKNPGKVTYASTGAGQSVHLAMEVIAKQEGIQWNLVPSPKVVPHILLLGGHVDACSSGAQWTPNVIDGSLRLLAVHGEIRMKTFPNVPTFRELGYDYISDATFLIVAPKGTPLSIVRKLDDAFRKGLDDPKFIHTMGSLNMEIIYRNHDDEKKFIEESYIDCGKLLKELGMLEQSEKK